MAYTVSTLAKGIVFGNKLTKTLRITADAATGVVTTGLQAIESVSFSPVSCPTCPSIKFNADASGTASNGALSITGTTSGNILDVIVYGY